MRVLVVDDNADSAETMAELMKVWGHDARLAYDGEQALKEAREFRPHVHLVDVGLPGMDGYELARRLREEGLHGGLMVCVSGYGQEEDRQRAQEAGFDRHVTKPVPVEILRQILEGALSSPSAP